MEFMSGGLSKQKLSKEIGFSQSTAFAYQKGTVPNEHIVKLTEKRYLGTAQILNANIWKILKGEQIEHREIQQEFEYFNSKFSINFPILNLEYWNEITVPALGPLLNQMIPVAYDNDEAGLLLQTILNIMSLVRNSNTKVWNELCETYRSLFPLFATQIHWQYKSEVFELIDSYTRLRKHQGINVIEDLDDNWTWRDRKLEISSVLDEHFIDQIYLYLHQKQVDIKSLPIGLLENFSSLLSYKICRNDTLLFHSWNLWEPACIELTKLLNEKMINNYEITAQLLISFLEHQGFFTFYPQELLNYAQKMDQALNSELRQNFDFVRNKLEITSVKTVESFL